MTARRKILRMIISADDWEYVTVTVTRNHICHNRMGCSVCSNHDRAAFTKKIIFIDNYQFRTHGLCLWKLCHISALTRLAALFAFWCFPSVRQLSVPVFTEPESLITSELQPLVLVQVHVLGLNEWDLEREIDEFIHIVLKMTIIANLRPRVACDQAGLWWALCIHLLSKLPSQGVYG